MISAAIQYAQRITTRASASFSHAGDRAVEHVAIALSTGRPVASWPAECVVRPAEGGGADDPAFVVFFMDDAISAEVRWEKGGGVYRLVTVVSVNPIFRLWERGIRRA